MAELKSIDMHDGGIEIRLSINKDEYKILKHHLTDLIIIPCGKEALARELTTGKLGNSNRMMIPKKMLESFKIKELDKKVPSNIFILDGNAFLLAKISRCKLGIPNFAEV